MYADHHETSLSIAAVSAPSVACSMLAVQQQKRLCRQFVDVSAARRSCHTMKQLLDYVSAKRHFDTESICCHCSISCATGHLLSALRTPFTATTAAGRSEWFCGAVYSGGRNRRVRPGFSYIATLMKDVVADSTAS